MNRAELAQLLWDAVRECPEFFAENSSYLQPGNDADGDGRVDRDDPLPFDRDNDNVADRLDTKARR